MQRVFGLGLVLLMPIFLAACGRDTSTVESSLNGHWSLADVQMNGRPIEEVFAGLEESLGSSSDGESSVEEVSFNTDFYFDQGQLTVVNGEGEQVNSTYEVVDTNEENSSLSLESPVSDENVDLTLNGLAKFPDEANERLDLTATMSDIAVNAQPAEGKTSVEAEFEQLGQQFAIEMMQNMEFELSLDYVDNEEAPAVDTAS